MARKYAKKVEDLTGLFEAFESVYDELDDAMLQFSEVSDEVGMSGEAIVEEMKKARLNFNYCWSIIEDILFDARQATGLPEREY